MSLVYLLASLDGLAAGLPGGADLPSHLAEAMSLARSLGRGELDLWFDGAAFGYPLFAAYPPLPTVLAAIAVGALEGVLPPDTVLSWLIVAVWMATPWAWAWGARRLGYDRLTALCSGVLAVAAVDATHFGLGIYALTDLGLWAQHVAMLSFPVAVGALHRHLLAPEGGAHASSAALLGALLLSTHGFFGMVWGELALLMLLCAPRGQRRVVLVRLVFLAPVVLVLVSPWLVPLVRALPELGGLPWRSVDTDGLSPRALLTALIGGEVFDADRASWLGPLVLLGALTARVGPALTEAAARARWQLALGVVGLAGMLGRATWGPGFDRLPLHADLDVRRYVVVVHAAGLWLAAPVLAWAARALARWLERVRGVWAMRWTPRQLSSGVVACALVGGPIVLAQAQTLTRAGADAPTPSLRALAEVLSRRTDGGRLHGDGELGTSSARLRNGLASWSGRALAGSHSRGYHDTLGSYYALSFDKSAEAARLYHITELVVLGSAGASLGPAWRQSAARGPYALWTTTASSTLGSFVRVPRVLGGPPRALRGPLGRHAAALHARGVLPGLDPAAPAEPEAAMEAALVALRGAPPTPVRSRLLGEQLFGPHYAARVWASGEERLVVAMNWDPGWRAQVDDREVPVLRSAPSFLAVEVPAGEHRVTLEYHGPPERGPLALLSAAMLLAVVLRGAFGRRVLAIGRALGYRREP